MTLKYTTSGSVRGSCGHRHESILAAARCACRDGDDCRRQGGYSDRTLVVIEDGERRRPTEEEYLDFCDRIDQIRNA